MYFITETMPEHEEEPTGATLANQSTIEHTLEDLIGGVPSKVNKPTSTSPFLPKINISKIRAEVRSNSIINQNSSKSVAG